MVEEEVDEVGTQRRTPDKGVACEADPDDDADGPAADDRESGVLKAAVGDEAEEVEVDELAGGGGRRGDAIIYEGLGLFIVIPRTTPGVPMLERPVAKMRRWAAR